MAWQAGVRFCRKNLGDAFQERGECQICHFHNLRKTARDANFSICSINVTKVWTIWSSARTKTKLKKWSLEDPAPTQAARQWLEEKIIQPNVFTQCQQDRECVLVCMLVVFIFKCSSGKWVTLVFANSRSRSTLMFKLALCGVVYLDCCFGLGCAQWIFLSVECPVGIFYLKCILSKESDVWIHEETS